MGEVYLAEHELMGRRAAVKVLLPQFSSNADMIKRFVYEARAVAAVKHVGIVEIYDVNYAEGGLPYIAMELLEGQDLSERLRQGELDRASAFAIAGQIADALDAAHRAGIVHRDLKPGNVFLRSDATTRPLVKLLDFGVAKVLEGHHDDHMTQTGMLVGTPSYMSPEQCRSQPVDHRADLYALGCMVFRMIAGYVPFRGESQFDVFTGHVSTPAPALSTVAENVAPALDVLVARLLAKAPADRPSSAGELVPVFAELEAAARRPRSAATSPGRDITLPTARVEIPDDAPTKQTVGVAQLAALAQPPPVPAAGRRSTASRISASEVATAPPSDEIEQMPSMLLVPEDLVTLPSAQPAAAARPLPGVGPRLASPSSPPAPTPAPSSPSPLPPMTPPPMTAATAPSTPAPTPFPSARAAATVPLPPAPSPLPSEGLVAATSSAPAPSEVPSAPSLPTWPPSPLPSAPESSTAPQAPSTMTLSSGGFEAPASEAGPRWRIWAASAVSVVTIAVAISFVVSRSSDRNDPAPLAPVAPSDAGSAVVIASDEARGVADDSDAGLAGLPTADTEGEPPPIEPTAVDEDDVGGIDVDAIEMGEPNDGARSKVARLRDAGPSPTDVIMSEDLRAEARAARQQRAYLAEHDLLYRAYRLDPRRRDLLDLGDAARLGGRLAQATAYYQGCIRAAPTSREADIARNRLEAIEREASGKTKVDPPKPPPGPPPVAPTPLGAEPVGP
jgi:serine/threonine protein kinase